MMSARGRGQKSENFADIISGCSPEVRVVEVEGGEAVLAQVEERAHRQVAVGERVVPQPVQPREELGLERVGPLRHVGRVRLALDRALGELGEGLLEALQPVIPGVVDASLRLFCFSTSYFCLFLLFRYCLPGPANLPSGCCASGLAGNDNKGLRVSRKHLRGRANKSSTEPWFNRLKCPINR